LTTKHPTGDTRVISKAIIAPNEGIRRIKLMSDGKELGMNQAALGNKLYSTIHGGQGEFKGINWESVQSS
jgi:hypothetical protein